MGVPNSGRVVCPTPPLELRPFQSLPFSSLAAEPFGQGGQVGVALAQPFGGACALLEWDQLGGRFRAPTVVNGESNTPGTPHRDGGDPKKCVCVCGGGASGSKMSRGAS